MKNQPKQLGLNVSIFEDFVQENRTYVDNLFQGHVDRAARMVQHANF